MRALDRIIAVIEAVAVEPDALTMTGVAERCDLSVATTSRLIRELIACGLLERGPESGRFRIGGRFAAIARGALGRPNLFELAHPEMTRLRDVTDETVSLSVRVGDRRVCIGQVESTQEIRRVVPLGLALPLHDGATGHVLAAAMLPEERVAYCEREGLDAQEQELLAAGIERVLVDGTAQTTIAGSAVSEVNAIAAPIRSGATTIAAMTVAGPSFRWTEERMMRHQRDVLLAGDAVSEITTTEERHGAHVV
jgi:DNA-binding IclR family transcriptional regulator